MKRRILTVCLLLALLLTAKQVWRVRLYIFFAGFAAVLALALLTDLSPVVFVALAAAAGIVVQNLIRRNG